MKTTKDLDVVVRREPYWPRCRCGPARRKKAAPRRRANSAPPMTRPLEGKTIAYLPIALGVPLSDEWGRVVQEEAEWRGMKYIVRDPNNNPSAMQQALTALVDQKPDVLIVQNPSVTLLDEGSEARRAAGHPRYPDQHVVELQVRRLRRRRLARDRQDCSRPTSSSSAAPAPASPARCRSCRAS